MNRASTNAELRKVEFYLYDPDKKVAKLNVTMFDGRTQVIKLKLGDTFTMIANTAFYDPELEGTQ
jgi:hypothetical protein